MTRTVGSGDSNEPCMVLVRNLHRGKYNLDILRCLGKSLSSQYTLEANARLDLQPDNRAVDSRKRGIHHSSSSDPFLAVSCGRLDVSIRNVRNRYPRQFK